jgi:hypothetical protein
MTFRLVDPDLLHCSADSGRSRSAKGAFIYTGGAAQNIMKSLRPYFMRYSVMDCPIDLHHLLNDTLF